MRQLIFGLFFIALQAKAQKQDGIAADIQAALSRGALVCSTAKANLKVGGVVLEDNSPGISFSYIKGATFKHKFIGKVTASNGQTTIYGHLAFLTGLPKAKSWFALSEEMLGKEYYQTFKFSPKYRSNGSIVLDQAGSFEQGRLNIRCTNFRDIAAFLPEMTEEQVSQLKATNTPSN